MFTLARAVTCIGHNTCLRRPQHLFTSATTPVYICWPQYLFMLARAVTFIGHNTCLRRPTLGTASATTPVYICQPQYLFTLARAVTCIGHNMCLRQPQHLFMSANTGTCVGHIIVPATGQWHSRLGTVCQSREWKQSAQCSAPMWRGRLIDVV